MSTISPNESYVLANGLSSNNGFIEIFLPRSPTTIDTNYPIQKRWYNTSTNEEFVLVGFTSVSGYLQANWRNIVSTLIFTGGTGTTGFPVNPNNLGQVQLTSNASTIAITGTTNSINFDLIGGATAIESVTGDDGIPVTPINGNINLVGNVVSNGMHISHPVYIRRATTNTEVVDVQLGASIVSTDATKVGMVAFDETQFNVDANGFVTSLLTQETGVFTPGISFGGTSTGIGYSLQRGYYTKIANVIFFSIGIVLSSKGTSTGVARITGIPYTSTTGSLFVNNNSIAQYASITFDAGYTQISAYEINTTSTLGLFQCGSGLLTINLTDTNFSAGSTIVFNGFFIIIP